MHELSLCRAILGIVDEHLAGRGTVFVKRLTLEVGQLAAVDNHALLFAFEAIARGTPLEGAAIEIITVPGLALCAACQKKTVLQHYYDACQHCGEFSLSILQGEEMRVKSMEIV